MLRRFFLHTGLAIIASVVCLFVADYVLFNLKTFDGFSLAGDSVTEDDLRWWKKFVMALPKDDGSSPIEPPEAIAGRAGTWYHRTGGRGSDGMNGVSRAPVSNGLTAYLVNADWFIVQGRALTSIDTCAYRIGVMLPCVMLERRYVGKQGVSTPAIDESEWRTNIRWSGFIANVALLSGLFSVPLVLHHGIRIARVLRGRCFRCAYILMPQQGKCSECGSPRRPWL